MNLESVYKSNILKWQISIKFSFVSEPVPLNTCQVHKKYFLLLYSQMVKHTASKQSHTYIVVRCRTKIVEFWRTCFSLCFTVYYTTDDLTIGCCVQ